MRNVMAAGFVILLSLPLGARADESMTPLAESGDWVALAHREDLSSPPDFCVAMNAVEHFMLRSDQNDLEVRYSDHSWSLPADVIGDLKLAINGTSYVLPITANTNITVSATVSQDQLEQIVEDMNKATSISVTAGSARAAQISLTGSNPVVTAFLTCAGINQPGNTGGANPFQSQPPSNPAQ